MAYLDDVAVAVAKPRVNSMYPGRIDRKMITLLLHSSFLYDYLFDLYTGLGSDPDGCQFVKKSRGVRYLSDHLLKRFNVQNEA